MLGHHFHLAQRTGAERHPAIPKASVTDKNRSDSATVRSQTRLRSPIKAPSASLKDAVPGSQPLTVPEPRSVDFFFSPPPPNSAFLLESVPLEYRTRTRADCVLSCQGLSCKGAAGCTNHAPWCAPPRCSHLRSEGSEIGERGEGVVVDGAGKGGA